MRQSYPSDITKEQFSIIEPILLSARKRTSPRKLNLYEIFCGVLYILKTGSNGECYRTIFQNGVAFIITSKFGVNEKMMSQAF